MSRSTASPTRDERGFTLIELLVALTLITIAFTALALVLSGGFGALASTRQRSAYVAVANAELEKVRSMPYDVVGVWTGDPDLANQYSGGTTHEGHDAVLTVDSAAPRAVTAVTNSAASGVPGPYTVRRWVTWWDAGQGTGHQFKRLKVEVEWVENNKIPRRVSLTSVLYPGGLGPVVSANADPAITAATMCADSVCPAGTVVAGATTVVFDAAATDANGDSLSYTWRMGDGTVAAVSHFEYVYGASGTYAPQVTVSDGKGGIAIRTFSLTVSAAAGNQPPVAGTIILSPASGVAPLDVDASVGDGWTDPDGPADTLTYTWDWGDGATDTGVSKKHKYTSAGEYTVRLTAKDTGGLTASTTVAVSVLPLNCDITDGYFFNPTSNTTKNVIQVSGANNTPKNTQFKFVAKTNGACNSLTGRVPYINAVGKADVFLVVLSTTDSGSTKTWTGLGSVNTKDMFSLGTGQTGEFWSPDFSGTAEKFPFSFNVTT